MHCLDILFIFHVFVTLFIPWICWHVLVLLVEIVSISCYYGIITCQSTSAEAGGVVTDAAGYPLDFSKGKHLNLQAGIIVTNQKLMPALLKAVKESLEEQASSLWFSANTWLYHSASKLNDWLRKFYYALPRWASDICEPFHSSRLTDLSSNPPNKLQPPCKRVQCMQDLGLGSFLCNCRQCEHNYM